MTRAIFEVRNSFSDFHSMQGVKNVTVTSSAKLNATAKICGKKDGLIFLYSQKSVTEDHHKMSQIVFRISTCNLLALKNIWK